LAQQGEDYRAIETIQKKEQAQQDQEDLHNALALIMS